MVGSGEWRPRKCKSWQQCKVESWPIEKSIVQVHARQSGAERNAFSDVEGILIVGIAGRIPSSAGQPAQNGPHDFQQWGRKLWYELKRIGHSLHKNLKKIESVVQNWASGRCACAHLWQSQQLTPSRRHFFFLFVTTTIQHNNGRTGPLPACVSQAVLLFSHSFMCSASVRWHHQILS